MAQKSTKEVRMYLRIRNLCGLLGILLPWIALFSAGLKLDKPAPSWWWSISATYYQTDALVGVLVPASIVLFPCKVDWIPDGSPVGFFQLPIELSNLIHMGCAVLFFLFAAINMLCLFTKHGDKMTDRRKVRNTIYRICGWGMIGLLALLAAIRLLSAASGWYVMIIEILLLQLFGFAWLVKGEFFGFLNDKQEDLVGPAVRMIVE